MAKMDYVGFGGEFTYTAGDCWDFGLEQEKGVLRWGGNETMIGCKAEILVRTYERCTNVRKE